MSSTNHKEGWLGAIFFLLWYIFKWDDLMSSSELQETELVVHIFCESKVSGSLCRLFRNHWALLSIALWAKQKYVWWTKLMWGSRNPIDPTIGKPREIKFQTKRKKKKKGTELAGPFSESVGYQSDSKKWTWFADQRRRMESMMGFAVSGGSILLKLESRKMYGWAESCMGR